jgi:hypothetical protein
MTTQREPGRITGPLKTWYDLHEALGHEATGIAEDADGLTLEHLDAFARRFWAFEDELRAHSEVEDGIMFPAIRDRGGNIDADLEREHRAEQLATYTLGSALLHANADRTQDALDALAAPAAQLRDSLLSHLAAEEATALTQVDGLFADDEQAALFHTIITSLPPDPRLQPWVAAALNPEHLAARLRNIASSTPEPAMASLMTQIHDGVDPSVWAGVESSTPELAALVTGEDRS